VTELKMLSLKVWSLSLKVKSLLASLLIKV